MVTARCTAALAAAAVAAAQLPPTSWNSLGTTYDLSAMTSRQAQGEYVLIDVRDILTEYHFNFFATVAAPLPFATNGVCTQWERPDNKYPALAWQIEKARTYPVRADDQCYRMGSINGSQAWQWSLVGAREPRGAGPGGRESPSRRSAAAWIRVAQPLRARATATPPPQTPSTPTAASR